MKNNQARFYAVGTNLLKKKRKMKSICELSSDEEGDDVGEEYTKQINRFKTPTTKIIRHDTNENKVIQSKEHKELKRKKQQTLLFFPTIKQKAKKNKISSLNNINSQTITDNKIRESQQQSNIKKRRKKSHKNFEQTFLDLGQKNFDLKTCKLCGMMYAPGKIEDEKIHRKVCKSLIKSME
jgi:hypothetical protein